MNTEKYRYLKNLITIITIIILDQISKNFIVNNIHSYHNEIIYINSFLNLVLVKNQGITFGFFNNFSYSNILFLVIASFTIIYLLIWLKNTSNMLINLALSFIIAGAIGNIIDRISKGAVIDFLDFHYKNYHWYSFNIADAAIVIGVIILFIMNITEDLDKLRKKV